MALNRYFSPCEWCFLPCLVSWLDTSAHRGERLHCLLQKSVVRQQVPCTYLPTPLHIGKDVPRAGYSKNGPCSLWPGLLQYYSSICEFNTPPRNPPSSSPIYYFCPPCFPYPGEAPCRREEWIKTYSRGVYSLTFDFMSLQGLMVSSPGCGTTSCSVSTAHCLVRIPICSQVQHYFSPGLTKHRLGCILSQHSFNMGTILGFLISQVFKLSLPFFCHLILQSSLKCSSHFDYRLYHFIPSAGSLTPSIISVKPPVLS